MSDLDLVLDAKDAQGLFGNNEKRARILYRRLARSVHPDMLDFSLQERANAAFTRLTELWEQWNAKSNPNASAANSASKKQAETISTDRRTYTVTDRPQGDPFFSRMNATYDGDQEAVILIATKPGNADLADRHVKSLNQLQKCVPEQFRGFYPKVLETFHYQSRSATHRGVVQSRFSGFTPFSKILEVYPSGINGRDVAWIFRRMLVAVGNAHDIGLVHGAVSMDALFVNPEEHGVILADWQYSVPVGESLRAVPQSLKADYPDEALAKKPVKHSLDISLCAKVADRLLESTGPRRMRNFFAVCMKNGNLQANVLLAEFDKLLLELYGEPTFHPFTLNPGGK